MITPEWTWGFDDATGEPVDEVSPVLTSQFEAEEWLGLHWRELAGRGVARAQLLRRGRPAAPAVDLASSLRAVESPE